MIRANIKFIWHKFLIFFYRPPTSCLYINGYSKINPRAIKELYSCLSQLKWKYPTETGIVTIRIINIIKREEKVFFMIGTSFMGLYDCVSDTVYRLEDTGPDIFHSVQRR